MEGGRLSVCCLSGRAANSGRACGSHKYLMTFSRVLWILMSRREFPELQLTLLCSGGNLAESNGLPLQSVLDVALMIFFLFSE